MKVFRIQPGCAPKEVCLGKKGGVVERIRSRIESPGDYMPLGLVEVEIFSLESLCIWFFGGAPPCEYHPARKIPIKGIGPEVLPIYNESGELRHLERCFEENGPSTCMFIVKSNFYNRIKIHNPSPGIKILVQAARRMHEGIGSDFLCLAKSPASFILLEEHRERRSGHMYLYDDMVKKYLYTFRTDGRILWRHDNHPEHFVNPEEFTLLRDWSPFCEEERAGVV